MEAGKRSHSEIALPLRKNSGQGLLEYALLLLLVTMVIIATLRALGGTVDSHLYQPINNAVTNAGK